MKRRLMALGMATIMVASLAACGGSKPAESAAAPAAAPAPAAAAPAAPTAPAGQPKPAETKAAAETKAPETTAAPAETTAAPASVEPTTMTLALRAGNYAEAIKASLPAFEEANNVKFEVLELAMDDLLSKITLDANNEKGAYDMIMVDGSWMAQFTEDGILANLSDMGYSFDDDIIPATTAICTVDGSVYLAPYYGNVTVMMYNKPLLEAAGYTDIAELDSWEDVMNIAKATSEAGKKGYLLRGGDAESMVVDFLPLLLANNGWVVDSEFKPTVNTDECKAALQQYIDLKAMGDIMVKDDMVAAVSNGDAALAVGWPGWVSNPTEDFNYTVIPTKLTEDDEPKLTAVYGVWTIGVPENAPNKDLSLKLIQHLMDADVQKASVEAGGVPCRKSVLEDPDVLKDHPAFAVVSNALAAGVYRPVMSTWVDYYNTFGAEIDNVVQGVKSVDQGLEDAQMNLEIFLN